MTDKPKRPMGRPRKNPPGVRTNVTSAVSKVLYDRVAADAKASGVSLSQAVERIIENHYLTGDILECICNELRPAPKMCDCGLYAGDACSDVRHCGTIS